jgi:hypothetical protein
VLRGLVASERSPEVALGLSDVPSGTAALLVRCDICCSAGVVMHCAALLSSCLLASLHALAASSRDSQRV